MKKEPQQWYSSWFDTKYYHMLYKDRDQTEAKKFIIKLTQHLNLPKTAKILDLACGKGRHSIYLNNLGYTVTGADLSSKSITFAKQFETETLKFIKHDMTGPLGKKYDAIFNFFTSFGYFNNDQDNLNTLKAIRQDLKENGIGVIDFMNVEFVTKTLVPENTKTIQGIDFKQKRYLKDSYIIKEITFMDKGEKYHFEERVKAFSLADFKALFSQTKLSLLEYFGDYKLNAFDPKTSERLILLFRP